MESSEKASPQKENGYTVVANELFEAIIRFRIPGECAQIFYAVMRRTYGFKKTEDFIANSQLVSMTGMKKANVSRSLSKLITHNLVIKSDNKLKINKNYKGWVPFVIKSDNSSKKLSKVITGVIKSDNKVLSEVMDTKERKENITKERGNDPQEKKGRSIKYLTEITAEDLQVFKSQFFISETELKNEIEKAVDYCKSKGEKYKDYQAFMRNWLRRGFKKRSEVNALRL